MSQYEEHTPMMQQYLAIKAKHQDALVLYRMGDFYELFFEDAQVAAPVLEVTLTARGQTNGNPIPMAGIPHHAADSYLAKLLKAGFKVAICEQIGEKTLKGPMQREVVQILTPGTLTEDALLQAKQSHFLIAITGDNHNFGLAALEVAAGRLILVQEASWDQLPAALLRWDPKEILCPDTLRERFADKAPCTALPSQAFGFEKAQTFLENHQWQTQFCGNELHEKAQHALGALITYLEHTQRRNLEAIHDLQLEFAKELLILDAAARRHLELTQSLTQTQTHHVLAVLDRTQTVMGSRMLARWLNQPIRNRSILQERLNRVTAFIAHNQIEYTQQCLKKIGDLERISTRIALLSARPRDLIELRTSLSYLPTLAGLLPEFVCNQWQQQCLTFEAIEALLNKAIVEEPPIYWKEGGYIKAGFDTELDRLRSNYQEIDTHLQNYQESVREETGIANLKVAYNKIHGFYIEVSRGQAKNLPAHFERRQTLKNSERFITDALRTLEHQILTSQAQAQVREKQIYAQVLQQLQTAYHPLQSMGRTIAELDVLVNFAERAQSLNLVAPTLTTQPEINIQQGRHLVVEYYQKEPFVPNSVLLNSEKAFALITGPNMGGKSTYMRQTALIVILAHIGCFVPAESARIGNIDRIFTRIGASDHLAQGRSTFMVEMLETAEILRHATPASLVLLDEIGRGTSTYDGVGIAYATALHLAQDNKALTLFSTHFHELTELEYQDPHIFNLHCAVQQGAQGLEFLHVIKPGSMQKSFGIAVAQLAGLPEKLIQKARAKIESLECPL